MYRLLGTVRHTGAMAKAALVLVATPIGNLDDLSPRAVAALASGDVVACEDTRRTGRLLAHLGISAPKLLVVNEHTEFDVTNEVVCRVAGGQRVVLVSDAGMPGISDPGELLVGAVRDAGLDVEVIPGPSASLAALVISGLPTGRFVFEGFLPRKGSARRTRLDGVAAEGRTVVLYEAPHRLIRTLDDLAAVCGGERRVMIARELTKVYEEHWLGTLAEARLRTDEVAPRGEYVLVLAGAEAQAVADDEQILAALVDARAGGASTRDAVDLVSAQLAVARNRVYAIATAAG